MKLKLITLLVLLLYTSCSTTRNLPEGEVLYTGIKKTTVTSQDKTKAGQAALTEVEAALAYSPNNALLGSSSIRIPFPFGLWVYNDFRKYKKGLGKWIFNKMAAKPVFISKVNPDVRVKVAQNLLKEYGFFNSSTSYTINYDKKNKRKAKISYEIAMHHPYTYDTITFPKVNAKIDQIIDSSVPESLLKPGNNFNVVQLEAERQRLSNFLRNNGYYYFRPDFIVFLADTIQAPGKVNLRVIPKEGLPLPALHPWYIGNISVYLNGDNNEIPNDSLYYRDMMIHYYNKLNVKPKVLYRRFRFAPGDLYTASAQDKTQQQLARLGIFKYTELQYTPQDTTTACDTLNLRINAAFDLPLDGELEVNVTSKSNSQLGPGAVFSVSKRNMFKGGETFSVSLRGSYEWQTGKRVDGNKSAINSYELGASSELNVPRIVFPWLSQKDYNLPATTTFRLYADQLNRAKFFKLLSFGGHATYNFQSSITSRHSVTPFKLTYNLLQKKTAEFDSITKDNPTLLLSLQNQFIPSMGYTYTYDNTNAPETKNPFWWESSITSAGNILSGVYALAGKKFSEEKKLLGNPFAQFIKGTSEIRYHYVFNRNQTLAMRLMGGVIYSYGNSNIAPYNEQFYIGGANSIRAFTVRSIGPGSFEPDPLNDYSYIDQTGDIKLEANIEYRFRILGNLFGAVFLDAGNIWLIREDTNRPGGMFRLKDIGKEIALGTGAGLRYDLDFLVLRFDVGVPLHVPYDTGKKGYYNIPSYKNGNRLGLHFAIGYPF